MIELDEKTLNLCRKYKRCLDCERVIPRGRRYQNYCPLCRYENKKDRTRFLVWYEKEGKMLENILPNPMPKTKEIHECLGKSEGKKHE